MSCLSFLLCSNASTASDSNLQALGMMAKDDGDNDQKKKSSCERGPLHLDQGQAITRALSDSSSISNDDRGDRDALTERLDRMNLEDENCRDFADDLQAEIDRQLDEHSRQLSKQIDAELQAQIDRELDKAAEEREREIDQQLDDQFEKYMAGTLFVASEGRSRSSVGVGNFADAKDDDEGEGDNGDVRHHLDVSPRYFGSEATVQSIDAQIQKIIDQHKAGKGFDKIEL